MKKYKVGQTVRVTVGSKTVHAEITSVNFDKDGFLGYSVFPFGNPVTFGVKRTVCIFHDEIMGLL